MSLKAKLISLISTFLLLCSLLTVGVFAVKNTTFNVGGDIVFNVHGIEATIALTDPGLQNIVLPNNVIAGTNVMNPITINNEKTAQEILDQYEKWSNLDLFFAPDKSTATIELVITNTTQDENNYIGISVTADALTKNNADISVVNNAGGTTAVIGKGESATFTITFSVIDDGYNASLDGFKVIFNMRKLDSGDLPTEDEAIVVSNDENLGTVEYELIDNQLNIIPSPKEGAKFVGYKKVVKSSNVNASASTDNDFTYLNTPSQGSIYLPYFAVNMGFNMDTAIELSKEYSSRIFMDYSAYTSDANFVATVQTIQNAMNNIDQKQLDALEMSYPGFIDSIKIVASGNPQITNYLDYSEGDKFIAVFTNGGEEITDSNGYTYQKFADVGFSMIKKFNLPDGGSTNLVLESYLGELPVIGFVQPSPNSSIFIFNDELTSVVVPDSYVVYPTSLFSGMSKLNSVTFGKGATSIPMDSFSGGCANLTEVIIPDSVTSIGAQAFMLCSSLSNIDLPNNLKIIAPAAFAQTGLSSIIIPDGTQSILDQAFASCKSLASITIGTGLTSIGNSVFKNCSALNTVNYRGTETQWSAITIGSNNSPLTNATKEYNYAG